MAVDSVLGEHSVSDQRRFWGRLIADMMCGVKLRQMQFVLRAVGLGVHQGSVGLVFVHAGVARS